MERRVLAKKVEVEGVECSVYYLEEATRDDNFKKSMVFQIECRIEGELWQQRMVISDELFHYTKDNPWQLIVEYAYQNIKKARIDKLFTIR